MTNIYASNEEPSDYYSQQYPSDFNLPVQALPYNPNASAMMQWLLSSGLPGLAGLMPQMTMPQILNAQGYAPQAKNLGSTGATNYYQDQMQILQDPFSAAMSGVNAFDPYAFSPTSTTSIVATPGRTRLMQDAANPESLEGMVAQSILAGDTPAQIRLALQQLMDADPATLDPTEAAIVQQIPTSPDQYDPNKQVPNLDYAFELAQDYQTGLATDPTEGPGETEGSMRQWEYDANGNPIQLVETIETPSPAAEAFRAAGMSPPTEQFTPQMLMGDDWAAQEQAYNDWYTQGGQLLDQLPINPPHLGRDTSRLYRGQRPNVGQPQAQAPSQQPQGGGGSGPLAGWIPDNFLTGTADEHPSGGSIGPVPMPDFGWAGPFEQMLGWTPFAQNLAGAPGVIADAARGAASGAADAAGGIPAPDFGWAGPAEQFLGWTPLAQGLGDVFEPDVTGGISPNLNAPSGANPKRPAGGGRSRPPQTMQEAMAQLILGYGQPIIPPDDGSGGTPAPIGQHTNAPPPTPSGPPSAPGAPDTGYGVSGQGGGGGGMFDWLPDWAQNMVGLTPLTQNLIPGETPALPSELPTPPTPGNPMDAIPEALRPYLGFTPLAQNLANAPSNLNIPTPGNPMDAIPEALRPYLGFTPLAQNLPGPLVSDVGELFSGGGPSTYQQQTGMAFPWQRAYQQMLQRQSTSGGQAVDEAVAGAGTREVDYPWKDVYERQQQGRRSGQAVDEAVASAGKRQPPNTGPYPWFNAYMQLLTQQSGDAARRRADEANGMGAQRELVMPGSGRPTERPPASADNGKPELRAGVAALTGMPFIGGRARQQLWMEDNAPRIRKERRNAFEREASTRRDKIYDADYGHALFRSYVMQQMGIRPIDMQIAARNQALAASGIRPS